MKKTKILTLAAMLLYAGIMMTIPAKAQNTNGMWRKTIIISTIDGTTMEYLINTDTKVKIMKPDLIIETEGVVLNYELEKMAQVRYGKKLVPSGIDGMTVDNQPFKWEDETIYFDHLSDNTLIQVFTADGKQVLSRRCSGNAQLPLNSLIDGVYLVKVNDSTYKILKR
jgi:hypothetical protein